ncbi:MAG: hypothetical protein KAF40_00290 [Flavihumibacter sp.]|nr:hypothetical protein [Flavihumibacter sp.]
MKRVPEQLKHIQEESQSLEWEEWYLQLCKLYAANDDIPLTSATRRVNVHAAREWYDAGFTPYGTFRENYSK